MKTTLETIEKMMEHKLTRQESRVFLEIHKAANEDGTAFIDHEGIRKTLGMSQSSLSYALKCLARKEALDRIGRNKANLRF